MPVIQTNYRSFIEEQSEHMQDSDVIWRGVKPGRSGSGGDPSTPFGIVPFRSALPDRSKGEQDERPQNTDFRAGCKSGIDWMGTELGEEAQSGTRAV